MLGRDGEVERGLSAQAAIGGSAERLLSAGLALLSPEETVFDAMLVGWEARQRPRTLAAATVE